MQVARCGGGGGDGGAAGEGVGRMGILEKEARRREGEGENCVIARVLQKVFVRRLKDDDAEGPRRERKRDFSLAVQNICTRCTALMHPLLFRLPNVSEGSRKEERGRTAVIRDLCRRRRLRKTCRLPLFAFVCSCPIYPIPSLSLSRLHLKPFPNSNARLPACRPLPSCARERARRGGDCEG